MPCTKGRRGLFKGSKLVLPPPCNTSLDGFVLAALRCSRETSWRHDDCSHRGHRLPGRRFGCEQHKAFAAATKFFSPLADVGSAGEPAVPAPCPPLVGTELWPLRAPWVVVVRASCNARFLDTKSERASHAGRHMPRWRRPQTATPWARSSSSGATATATDSWCFMRMFPSMTSAVKYFMHLVQMPWRAARSGSGGGARRLGLSRRLGRPR